MHIPPHDNHNAPIIDCNDARVPLNYFNIVKLTRGQAFEYQVPGYETCIVPATGTVDVDVGGMAFAALGNRGADVWDGEPEGVYVPSGAVTRIVCISAAAEVFVAGARFDGDHVPFDVRATDIDVVQYGSDDTKTHRKIKHILGAKTRHDETYNFRFRPAHGFGLQLVQRQDGAVGDAYHIVDGSTVVLDRGYHPCVAAPGYEMYYFTILGGETQRSLVQYFQPSHAYQIETIPGIKDMIAKFK